MLKGFNHGCTWSEVDRRLSEWVADAWDWKDWWMTRRMAGITLYHWSYWASRGKRPKLHVMFTRRRCISKVTRLILTGISTCAGRDTNPSFEDSFVDKLHC